MRPAAQAAPRSPERRSRTRHKEDGLSLHFPNSWLQILLVARDPERLHIHREALRGERGIVRVAHSGAEALALLRAEDDAGGFRPNAVVLDGLLPEPEWPTIAAGIVGAALDAPVIVVEWLDTEVAADPEAKEPAPARELSRLIRHALVYRRTEDELAARVRNERFVRSLAAEAGQPGGEDEGPPPAEPGPPGSLLGVGEHRLHMMLRESTEAQLLAGLRRFRELASHIRRLTRRSQGDVVVAAEAGDPVSPRDLIEEAVARYRAAAEAKGVVLVSLEDEYAPYVLVDKPGLLAALGTMIAYVLHVARPGGTIRVSAWVGRNSSSVRFHVADEGPGIDERLVPLVSDPFAALAPILEAHGTRLRFGSTPRKGCGFGFDLPESLARPVPDDEEDDGVSAADGSGLRGSAVS